MPRETAYGRLLRHFHTHPKGRLHEVLFFTGLGLLLGGGAWIAHLAGKLSLPLALICVIVAICFVGIALLPQKRVAQRPDPPGRLRAEKAKAVRASKEEGKRFKAAKRGER